MAAAPCVPNYGAIDEEGRSINTTPGQPGRGHVRAQATQHRHGPQAMAERLLGRRSMAIVAGVVVMAAALVLCLSLPNAKQDVSASPDLRGKLGHYARQVTPPTYDQLQQFVEQYRGKRASKQPYQTDDEGAENTAIHIYALGESAFVWTADMDVDCDGIRSGLCNTDTDDAYQPMTSFTTADGKYLDATKVPYFVIPSRAPQRFDYTKQGICGGAVGLVMYNGKVAYGVFGDEGPDNIIGEASYAMVKALGANPSPRTGGVDEERVTYIVFKGKDAVPKDLGNPQEAQRLGQEKAAKLLALRGSEEAQDGSGEEESPAADDEGIVESEPSALEDGCRALGKGMTKELGDGTWKAVPGGGGYKVHEPYSTSDDEPRFTASGSTYIFKVYGDDNPFQQGSKTKPRTEMRFCPEYTSGVHQFAAKVTVPGHTDQVNIFQIKTVDDQYSPNTWQLRVVDGQLRTGPRDSTTVAWDIHGRKLRLNVIYDAGRNKVDVYVDGEWKVSQQLFGGDEGTEVYFKCGTYATQQSDTRHRLMEAIYQDITIYSKQGGSASPKAQPGERGSEGRARESLFSLKDARATYYYDLHTSCPQDPHGYPGTNNGYPLCTSHSPDNYKTLRQYGSNNVIAIDAEVLGEARAALCGKKAIVRVNGRRVEAPDGGDFVVWDGCAACAKEAIVDFSVSGARRINPQACQIGAIEGITLDVVDEQVWEFIP